LLLATAADSRKILRGISVNIETRKGKLILKMDDPIKKKTLQAFSVLCVSILQFMYCSRGSDTGVLSWQETFECVINPETEYKVESKMDLFIHTNVLYKLQA
jgi:hypothetical protein